MSREQEIRKQMAELSAQQQELREELNDVLQTTKTCQCPHCEKRTRVRDMSIISIMRSTGFGSDDDPWYWDTYWLYCPKCGQITAPREKYDGLIAERAFHVIRDYERYFGEKLKLAFGHRSYIRDEELTIDFIRKRNKENREYII